MSDPIPVWVINQDSKPERLAHMRAELMREGVAFDRFPALGPDALPDWLRPMFQDASGAPHGPLSPGEIGCYASHLTLIARIAASGRPGLILEDDLRLFPGFGHFARAIPALPPDWAFLRLSNPAKSACRRIADTPAGTLVEYWRTPNNMGAYLVSPEGAARFLAAHDRRIRAIDEDVRRPWETDAVSYGLLPALAEVNIFDASGISAMGGRSERAGRKRFRGNRPGARLTWLIRRWGMGAALRAVTRKATRSLKARATGRKPDQNDLIL